MTAQDEIKSLFNEKLTPGIQGEVEVLTTIKARRAQIEETRQGFIKKIESTHGSITVLEQALDDKIVSGKSPAEVINTLALRRGELTGYERQIQRLQGEDTDAAHAEGTAQKALSQAIGKQLEDLRPDIQVRLEELLKDVVIFLCSYECGALDTARDYGVELPNDTVVDCFRFLNTRWMDHLAAFCQPIGADMSIIRRREAREQVFAPEPVAEPENEVESVEQPSSEETAVMA